MMRFRFILLLVCVAAGLSSCHSTIHIHPDREPGTDEKVWLTLHVDNAAPRLGTIIDYTVTPAVIIYADDLPQQAVDRARAASGSAEKHGEQLLRARALADAFDQVASYDLDGDNWELRLKYEIYAGTADQVRQGAAPLFHSGETVYRADTFHPEHDVEVELPFGDVTVVAVAHIVPAETEGDWFFETSTLRNIVCDMDRWQGEHDKIYRDCFVVGEEYHIEPSGIDGNERRITATLTRPSGRYVVIADDYETYLGIAATNLADAESHIHYPSYINVAYSVLSGAPVDSSFDFGYDFRPALVYAEEAPYVRLGDDWSFVNGNRSDIHVDITVSDRTDGRVVSRNPGILVPLFPGRVTLVVGHWLTEVNEGGGGVLIDPDFSDEIVIHF